MLNELGGTLVRRAWIIGVCVLAFAGAAVVAAKLHTKQYTASSALLLRERTFGEGLLGGAESRAEEPSRNPAAAALLISLPIIAERTADNLPDDYTGGEIAEKVEVQVDPGSNLVRLNATDSDPTAAAAIANAYAEQFIAFKHRVDRGIVIAMIHHAKSSPPGLLDISPGSGEARGAFAYALARLRVLTILQVGDVERIAAATAPSGPSSPRTARDILLGAVVGLIVGAALAALTAKINRRIRSARGLEAQLGMPVISAFSQTEPSKPRAGSQSDETSALPAAGIEMLRARIQYYHPDRKICTVLVTSAGEQEGKTTLSRNVVAEAAAAGVKSILIEPLRGRATKELLDRLESDGYELIVIDAAPQFDGPDETSLVHRVDGVIVVGRIGRTTLKQAHALGEKLRALGAPVLGAVANAISSQDAYASALGGAAATTPITKVGA